MKCNQCTQGLTQLEIDALPELDGTYRCRCEDHWAEAQPIFGSCVDYLIDDPQLLDRIEEPAFLEVA